MMDLRVAKLTALQEAKAGVDELDLVRFKTVIADGLIEDLDKYRAARQVLGDLESRDGRTRGLSKRDEDLRHEKMTFIAELEAKWLRYLPREKAERLARLSTGVAIVGAQKAIAHSAGVKLRYTAEGPSLSSQMKVKAAQSTASVARAQAGFIARAVSLGEVTRLRDHAFRIPESDPSLIRREYDRLVKRTLGLEPQPVGIDALGIATSTPALEHSLTPGLPAAG